MESDDVEVTLHHHGTVFAADLLGRPLEAEQVLALLEQLGLGRVEVLGFAAIEAAAAKTDHPPLAVLDRHHQPAPEAVVEAIPALARHHQPGRLQPGGLEALHLLEVLEQPIPLIGGIAQFKRLDRGGLQAPAFLEVSPGWGSLRRQQLAAEIPMGQAHHPVQLLPA